MGLLPNSWSKKPWKEKRRPLFIAGLILFLSCFVAPFFCRSELYDETVTSRFVVEQLSKDIEALQWYYDTHLTHKKPLSEIPADLQGLVHKISLVYNKGD